jgi:hypothetical protein
MRAINSKELVVYWGDEVESRDDFDYDGPEDPDQPSEFPWLT